MRLPTDQEMDVFEFLLHGNEMHGYEMVKKSDGLLSSKSIYVVLMRMVARGLLTDRLETREEAKETNRRRGARRRYYKISAHGLKAREARLLAGEVIGDLGDWAPLPIKN